MIDWIFEEIIKWVSKVVTRLLDAVSGLFLNVLGTDMTVMETYFPFLGKAFSVMQYLSWTLLFLITVWQLFRAFGGPITEAENPWSLLARSALFAFLIGFAKPIFLFVLQIAKAPYTAFLEISMGAEDFSFAGIEAALKNGMLSLLSTSAVVGTLLIVILEVALGWNYFKLLLEVVERYVVVGVLCYTSPLAYAVGGSKATGQVFRAWCRMVGSQMLLLVMNVWFLRGFNSAVGYFIGSGGAVRSGEGNIFLWLFCALAFLKVAQRFDTYLASVGLNVAQTGSNMGAELLMTARTIGGLGRGIRAGGTGTPVGGFKPGFASRFKGNSYIRDSVVQGGTRMGAGGGIGFVARMFSGMAARNGATLTGESIASVANQTPGIAGKLGGEIADRSLCNYLPHLRGRALSGTEISGGMIRTEAVAPNGKTSGLQLYNAAQFERPSGPHLSVTASDGSRWYQVASGAGASDFYPTPAFTGALAETEQMRMEFPDLEPGTTLRTVGDGRIEATTEGGNAVWYHSAYYEEPGGPHQILRSADGAEWYAMRENAQPPAFEAGEDAAAYNCARFENAFPGYDRSVTDVDASGCADGRFEVRNEDGSGTRFYDANRYQSPRGDYEIYEDANGDTWYAIHGTASVERVPVYEDGKPVYDGENVRSATVESVRYAGTPQRYGEPERRAFSEETAPKRKTM